jgi:hypothetical protein
MLSKEEAVALPVILVAWFYLVEDHHHELPRVIVALGGPVVLYFALRASSGALTPGTAPSYYQFSFSPWFVWHNLLEYVDRGASVFVGGIAIALAATGRGVPPAWERRRVLAACAIWFAGGYSLTLFLPVRSSLYALLPSVGAAIACGSIVETLVTRASSLYTRRMTPLRFMRL